MTTQTISQKVAEGIVAAAPQVLDSVVKTMVEKETDRRAAALLGAVELGQTTQRELSKAIQPDVRPTTFDSTGKPLGEVGFTKSRLAEQKKLTERLAKVNKAIEKATRDRASAIEAKDAVGTEGQDGYVPAVKAVAAIEPDYADLFNLKNLVEQAEKEAAKPETTAAE